MDNADVQDPAITFHISINEHFKKILPSQATFTEAGIQVVVPDTNEIDYIADKIHDELEIGIIKPPTRDNFLDIIERMYPDEGIEAIILGCTELSLLFVGTELPVKALDTVDIHIETLFKVLQ